MEDKIKFAASVPWIEFKIYFNVPPSLFESPLFLEGGISLNSNSLPRKNLHPLERPTLTPPLSTLWGQFWRTMKKANVIQTSQVPSLTQVAGWDQRFLAAQSAGMRYFHRDTHKRFLKK